MHRLAILAALVALAPLPLALRAAPEAITARPVPLDPHDPGRIALGKLRYLGGWVLKSRDRRFGGISSMTLQDGRFVMLSDGGVVTRFRFSGEGEASDVSVSELPGGPGDGSRKVDRDSESSVYDPASGHVWAGFETRNEIWRYTRNFAAANGHVAPKAMANWGQNEGAEAMVRLHDGRFLVFGETETRKNGDHLVLLFPQDPVEGGEPVQIGYKGPGKGLRPTDAVELPDGRVLVLHRRFTPTAGFSAALSIVDPRGVGPDGHMAEEVIVPRWAPPLTVDNMEALAVEQDHGRTILWIASDDNFFFLERTLLMRFELPAGR
jgi:hypothetical protein